MKIEVKIQTLMPDRTTYKQYGTTYQPENLYVEVEIPDEEVVEKDSTRTTLTERGTQLLMSKLADIADTADEKFRHSKLPKQK